jgi:hypothetical protein
MVHIIGVAHQAQVTSPGAELTEDQKQLFDSLSQLVQEVGATLIAEEQSLEALGNNLSLPQQIAQNNKIEHRFCDPDSNERVVMGYRDRQSIGQEIFFSDEGWELSPAEIDAKAGATEIARYFPLRERFWFERLADHVDSEIAFVCGDAHIEGFVGLLKEKEVSYRVCDRGIGLNDEDKYVFESAMKYLEQHPEIRDH